MKKQTAPLQRTRTFEWLRDVGISEPNLQNLERHIADLPAQWKQRKADERANERRRRLSRLSSRLRRLARDLDADLDAAHITLTEVRDAPNGFEVMLVRSKYSNRPTIGAVLALLADDLGETGTKPLYLQWHRLMARNTYVIGGIAHALLETGRYGRTPNKHVAELASVVLRKRINAETVRTTVKRLKRD